MRTYSNENVESLLFWLNRVNDSWIKAWTRKTLRKTLVYLIVKFTTGRTWQGVGLWSHSPYDSGVSFEKKSLSANQWSICLDKLQINVLFTVIKQPCCVHNLSSWGGAGGWAVDVAIVAIAKWDPVEWDSGVPVSLLEIAASRFPVYFCHKPGQLISKLGSCQPNSTSPFCMDCDANFTKVFRNTHFSRISPKLVDLLLIWSTKMCLIWVPVVAKFPFIGKVKLHWRAE